MSLEHEPAPRDLRKWVMHDPPDAAPHRSFRPSLLTVQRVQRAGKCIVLPLAVVVRYFYNSRMS